MNNIEELRAELIDIFEKVKSDPKYASQAKAMVDVAGKIVATCGVQINYATLQKKAIRIPFLDATATQPNP